MQHPQHIPGGVLDQDRHELSDRVGVEPALRLLDDSAHDRSVDHRETHRKSLSHMINSAAFDVRSHHQKPDLHSLVGQSGNRSSVRSRGRHNDDHRTSDVHNMWTSRGQTTIRTAVVADAGQSIVPVKAVASDLDLDPHLVGTSHNRRRRPVSRRRPLVRRDDVRPVAGSWDSPLRPSTKRLVRASHVNPAVRFETCRGQELIACRITEPPVQVATRKRGTSSCLV